MFYFGADYYPEYWPEERWPIDARLMAEAGFNVVRLTEFAWVRMEPGPGRYNFDWLDRVLDILSARGIKAVLGTPTASPPPWLMTRHPEVFRVRQDGLQVTFGNRREYCPNHTVYHDYSRRIVTQMAEHYGSHPAVVGWQIDNEFGDRCYCPACHSAFQGWLRGRYGLLEELNRRWGTLFWSHVYTDWGQIPVPLATGGSPNPGLALDFYRFMSDSYVAYQQMQVDALRPRCPGQFITHNFMGFGYEGLDYYDLARTLDLVAWDNYPRTQWGMTEAVDPSPVALAHDTMRGLKRQNFWIMEQEAGPSGWELVSVPPRPGELRLWAYQSIAHGADAIVFFRWRTARHGTEQYWHGLLDHDGTPGRRYQEIKRMGAEIKRIGEMISGATIKPAVAMLQSYDSRFAFQIQQNNPQFSYYEQFHRMYRALHRRNVPVDVLSAGDDLSTYKLVIAPALHVVSGSVAANLKHFVENGGILVVTPRSGVKDESNAVVDQRLPGLLAEICGVEVREYDSLAADMSNAVKLSSEKGEVEVPVGIWCDVLKPNGAEVVGRYMQDYYAGEPAVTLNRFGKGQAVYVGAFGDAPLYDTLSGWLLDLVKVQPLLAVPEGVEVTERWQGDQRLLFVLNHSRQAQMVSLPGHYTNLLDGAALEGAVSLAAGEVWVLVKERSDQ